MEKKNKKHLQSNGLANMQTSSKSGFTLAEVLITLGIIGVVAAMTIPTLMVDINTKQWATAANVFEKKLNEAMKNMNTAQVISGHSTTLSFVQELGNHFKINKICKNNELQNCFPETVYWGAGEATPEEVDMKEITQASHFGLQNWGTELIGVQFANGVAGLVAYNPKCSGDPYSNQFNGAACISMLYDTSGNKNPNTSGKDLGNYGVIKQLGDATCAFEINGTCYSAPFVAVPHTWNACSSDGHSTDPEDVAFMQQYGLTYCMTSDEGVQDYWAGAVKACGGVNKMPTLSQVADIANYLYGRSDIGAQTDIANLSIDDNKVNSLGLNSENTNSEFIIWTSEINPAIPENTIYTRIFTPTETYWNEWYARCATGIYAVCIGN